MDTYDEDFPNVVTPQGVRLTKDFNGEHGEYDPNECIASPAYFAENRRASRGSKERNLSISDNPIGDVFL